ncbi:MAG: ABC transporter substrate-binding protein, partial [Paracoccaceae bacterium]|nr:ABC transporter substrate-binding protein [Paracoccaceae bacterium]
MPSTKCKSSAVAALLLSAATPALAQSDICGGFGNGGVWIGGDEASSDITTADSYREQMALVLGGNDYVSLFTLTAPTDIRVEAEGRGSGDPIIDLLDGSGGIILSDDDSGGNAASRAETTLEAGTYCMSMRSYDGGPMT